MSRTYKTDPLWVQMNKNRNGDFPINHDHATPGHEECDADVHDGRSVVKYHYGACKPVFRYYNKRYLRYITRPSTRRDYDKFEHAKARTAERNALAKAKYLDAVGIENFDLPESLSRKDLWWGML